MKLRMSGAGQRRTVRMAVNEREQLNATLTAAEREFTLRVQLSPGPNHFDLESPEPAVRLSEERLAHALSATSDGLWDCDIATGDVYFSPQWIRLLGYEPGEVPARVEFFYEVVHPDDAAGVRKVLADHLAGRTPMKQNEIRLRTKAGDYR